MLNELAVLCTVMLQPTMANSRKKSNSFIEKKSSPEGKKLQGKRLRRHRRSTENGGCRLIHRSRLKLSAQDTSATRLDKTCRDNEGGTSMFCRKHVASGDMSNTTGTILEAESSQNKLCDSNPFGYWRDPRDSFCQWKRRGWENQPQREHTEPYRFGRCRNIRRCRQLCFHLTWCQITEPTPRKLVQHVPVHCELPKDHNAYGLGLFVHEKNARGIQVATLEAHLIRTLLALVAQSIVEVFPIVPFLIKVMYWPKQ